MGVQRTRTDRYFDGTRGKRLVKIVPFDHPLSPLDVDELKRELEARPEEDRDIELVCLGVELAASAAVDEWNRFRTRGHGGNRLHVIELRSDPVHGGVIDHRPAQANVRISRTIGKVVVEIRDFLSPTIIERLKQQAGVLNPQIEDWRAMVDSVMIDWAYDGAVFNVCSSDIPERKTDLVEGRYEIDAPSGETTVAVKITDMLGEEVLVTKRV